MHGSIEFVPAGRAKGLLPRQSKVGERCGVWADSHVVVPRAEWDALLPGHVGLDPFVSFWLDQDGVGSCAAESESNGYMLLAAASGRAHVALNPWGMYHTTSGGRDGGSSLESNLEFGYRVGHFPETVWPRSKGWRAKPSAEAVAAAANHRNCEHSEVTSIDAAGSAMFAGYPFYYGSRAHAKCGIRVLSRDWFKYLNSWGKGWSDPMAGRWIASQLWPDRAEAWLFDVGVVASQLRATPEGRSQWDPGFRRRWLAGYETLNAGGEMACAEQVRAALLTDEWSGRGVERFSTGINWGYGAYAPRAVADSTAT